MKENYLIFYKRNGNFGAWAKTDTSIDIEPQFFAKEAISKPIEVMSVELSAKDAMAIQKDEASGVIVMAPVMPLMLIDSIESNEVIPMESNIWGMDAVGALGSNYTGQGIVCAVLDTGIDATSPAFAGMELLEEDFTGTGNGDTHGHGTHCAGSFFGRPVDGCRIGVAQGVQKALIGKVLAPGKGDTRMLIDALDWALDNEANVISMSLGIDFPGHVQKMVNQGIPLVSATSKALSDYQKTVTFFERYISYKNAAVGAAGQQPFVVIAAAGNESRRRGIPNFELFASPPAVSEGVISVAALMDSGDGMYDVADFSNIGAKISAPGVNIVSAKPGGGLVAKSGTSMATPYVAGCAALWAEKLKAENLFSNKFLESSLLYSAQRNKIKLWNMEDHGVGIVRTP